MKKKTEATTSTPDQAAAAAAQGANVAPETAPSKKAASKKKGAPRGQKQAKGKAKATAPKEAKPKKAAKPAAAKEPGTMRPDSKGAQVLGLISRPKGASLAEIMKATDWQAHSVRGFISGALGKKLGIKVNSAKREDGERIYSIGK
jgi:DNA replication initiation complex subunit (GINS family)